jgi:hypothetical protein
MNIIRICINDMAGYSQHMIQCVIDALRRGGYQSYWAPNEDHMQTVLYSSTDPFAAPLDALLSNKFLADCGAHGLYIDMLTPDERVQYEPFVRGNATF